MRFPYIGLHFRAASVRHSAGGQTVGGLIDGIKEHYVRMTIAQSEMIVIELQSPWDVKKSLSEHVMTHARKNADLKAGKRETPDQEGKACWEPKASFVFFYESQQGNLRFWRASNVSHFIFHSYTSS